jgi:glutamine amidotransferase
MTIPAVPNIGLVDYGMGNRRSVEKALERVGARVARTADHDELRAADGLLVPGVGAFNAGMRALRETGLDEVVRERAAAGTPVFGACLGMQLLFEGSEEHGGGEPGLGLLAGTVRRLDPRGLKLPHIGWNEVRWQRPSPLSDGLPDPSTFYHVHSYVPHPSHDEDVIGVSDYGSPFATVVGRANVYGAQFHPEKSSVHGLALLANFTRLCAPVAVS